VVKKNGEYMYKNYLTTALRNLKIHKFYSLINILGLAIGFTVCLLILLWVQDEWSFDRFHKRADHIYRVVFADESYDNIQHYSVTPPALAAALKKDYPEIIHSVTYYSHDGVLMKHGEKMFKEKLGYASASLFDIFSIHFVSGNSEIALQNPYSIILTEKTAKKYFGDEDPISKTVTIENKTDFIVTAIVEDLPENSSLQFDAITHFQHLYEMTGRGKNDSWDSFGYNTFILLTPKINSTDFSQKIADYIIRRNTDDTFKPKLYLQPFSEIHLYNLNGGGIIIYIYIFSFIAIFLMVLACINFINLVTARSAVRIKEISLRKVIGANRKNLIFQFLGESIFLTLFSLILSLIFVERLLPVFNDLTGKSLSLEAISTASGIILLCSITIFTGIIAGSYPAFFLSGFKPVTILKNYKISGSSPLRNFLVVFQFSISIIMIISTIVIFNQLNFIKNMNLGFNKDHIIYISLNQELSSNIVTLKNEMKNSTRLKSVAVTSNKIGISQFQSVDINQWEGNFEEKSILLNFIFTDYDFLNTFNIEMMEGRFYSEEITSDSVGLVLNEAAIKEMGINDPIGKKILSHSHIIGVIKDFNFQSLHSRIYPLAIGMNPTWNRYLAVKVSPENIEETIDHIKSIVTKFAPDFPFEYQFLDQEFDRMYDQEQRLGKLFIYFSILAVLISALGLLGLASFMAGQRTKEIGIRKVLGASIYGILLLLSKEFTKWILLANVIAWPIAWYIMTEWLKDYAYRAPIEWWVFIVAGFSALLIALMTVSSQALRTALSNPIEALRYE
jgi:hypothetical protein